MCIIRLNSPCINDLKRKQTEDQHDQEPNDGQSVKLLKQSCLVVKGNKIRLQIIKDKPTSDSESEQYTTPPAMPNRVAAKTNIQGENKVIKLSVMEVRKQQDEENMQIDADQDNSNNTFQQVMKETLKNTRLKSSEELQVEGDVDQIPETMDVKSVHAMFKKLESKFEERVKAMETELQSNTNDKSLAESCMQFVSRKEYEKVVSQLKTVQKKNYALNSAVKSMWEEIEDMMARMEKVEINNYKKAVAVTGLYTSDDKETAIHEFQEFIQNWFNFSPAIDDLYSMGHSSPRMKVVIFSNTTDKEYILNNKAWLKEARNEDRKKYTLIIICYQVKKPDGTKNEQFLKGTRNQTLTLKRSCQVLATSDCYITQKYTDHA